MLGYPPTLPPPPPPGSLAADRPTRRPPRFGSTNGGGGGVPPPPTAPKTVAHTSGSHVGWRRPPWSPIVQFPHSGLHLDRCISYRPQGTKGEGGGWMSMCAKVFVAERATRYAGAFGSRPWFVSWLHAWAHLFGVPKEPLPCLCSSALPRSCAQQLTGPRVRFKSTNWMGILWCDVQLQHLPCACWGVDIGLSNVIHMIGAVCAVQTCPQREGERGSKGTAAPPTIKDLC